MTSFVLEPRRDASAWISSFSSSGMRRSTTGLEPGSALRRVRRHVLDAEASARMPTATSLRLAPASCGLAYERPFREEGVRTRTPLRVLQQVLAAKVLAV